MRLAVVGTLAGKEVRRLAGNRGALAVTALLVASALGLALADRGPALAGGGELRVCWVDYWGDGPWVGHLRANVPPGPPGRARRRGSPARRAGAGGRAGVAAGRGPGQVRGDGAHPVRPVLRLRLPPAGGDVRGTGARRPPGPTVDAGDAARRARGQGPR